MKTFVRSVGFTWLKEATSWRRRENKVVTMSGKRLYMMVFVYKNGFTGCNEKFHTRATLWDKMESMKMMLKDKNSKMWKHTYLYPYNAHIIHWFVL